MADRPILFSAPMVRALLDGRKTQTRRVIPENLVDSYYEYDDWCSNVSAGVPTSRQWEKEFFLERCRYAPGGRLWVRERAHLDGEGVNYAADLHPQLDISGLGYRPSIHMPRAASRLTLIVESVKVERLQDMEGQHPSESDAIAEGVHAIHHGDGEYYYSAFRDEPHPQNWGDPTDAFRELWNSINGPDAWDANPWCAAISFSVIRKNIDQLEQ